MQSTDEISENGSVVAGPVHSSFRELVESSIYFDIIKDRLNGKNVVKADIFVNPKEISKAVGNRRSNIERVKNELSVDIHIYGDEKLRKREVRCNCC